MLKLPTYEVELRAPLHPKVPADAEPLKVYSHIVDIYYRMQPRLRARQALVETPEGLQKIGAITLKKMTGHSAGKMIEYETAVENPAAPIAMFDEIFEEQVFRISGSRRTFRLPLSEELRTKYKEQLPEIDSVTLCIDKLDNWKVSDWSEIEVMLPLNQKLLQPGANLLYDIYEVQLGTGRHLTTDVDYVELSVASTGHRF